MDSSHAVELEAPRFEYAPERKIAGFCERYRNDAIEGIPGLWYRFAPAYRQSAEPDRRHHLWRVLERR
ncbi:MAG: hypothetical protein WDN30_10470 [Pararobbsia sp.]